MFLLIKILTIIFFFFISPALKGQTNRAFGRVVFYNVENLFDIEDDPDTSDEEFTPAGERHWNYFKLDKKLNGLAKVLVAAGQFEIPEIVGLAEVENREVLERLIAKTILKNSGYQIIHKESPDQRGIDVALLYDSNKVYPLTYQSIPLYDKGELINTREIVYFSGIFQGVDTLHFFINHWPSRFSGLLETVHNRGIAALTLKNQVDSIRMLHPLAKIVIMGDFNDQPTDESVLRILKAHPVNDGIIDNHQLYNLSASWDANSNGTLKYQSLWFVFDQVIVSGSLLNSSNGLCCTPEDAFVFKPSFLYEEDKRYSGKKLFRTFNGYTYNGGYSDHLPVCLDIRKY